MGYVRELRKQDVGEARRIAFLKDRHSGTTPITEDGLDTILASVGDTEAPRKAFGYFEGDNLISWLAVRYTAFFDFETQLDEKVWLITGLFTSQFHNHFSFGRPEAGTLIAHAFKLAEAEGFYTYVYSVANRLARVYEKQWFKQTWLPATGRYDLLTIGVVPANTEPPTEWQKRMMGGVKPDDIVFKKRVLKQIHRK
jgi:hypothetical protein